MMRGRKKNCGDGMEMGGGTRSAGMGWEWGQCSGNGVGMGTNSYPSAALESAFTCGVDAMIRL